MYNIVITKCQNNTLLVYHKNVIMYNTLLLSCHVLRLNHCDWVPESEFPRLDSQGGIRLDSRDLTPKVEIGGI